MSLFRVLLSLFRVLLQILGVYLSIYYLIAVIFGARDLGSLFGLVLAFFLIVSPFTTLYLYLLLLVGLVGFPLLGGYIGAQISGKDSIGVWLGLIGGFIVGIKIMESGLLDNLLLSKLRKLDEKNENKQHL